MPRVFGSGWPDSETPSSDLAGSAASGARRAVRTKDVMCFMFVFSCYLEVSLFSSSKS